MLRALPVHEQEKLAATMTLRTLKRGERYWSDGRPSEGFSFVVRGNVKLITNTEAGREAILEIAGGGELLCGNAPCAFAPYCCSTLAMEDGTEVLSIPRWAFMEALERNPDAARSLLHEMACRGQSMCKRVEELSAGQVAQRVAKLLLRLADRAGVERSGEGIWVPIQLSRQDLADLCGTTIESAIRVMSSFARSNIVKSATRGFVICDSERLAAVARGRSPR